jgi:hypothetical protein
MSNKGSGIENVIIILLALLFTALFMGYAYEHYDTTRVLWKY